MNKSNRATSNAGKPITGGSSTPPAIDIERLAEKVYQLMQADIRQTRARSGMTPTMPVPSSISVPANRSR